MFIVLDLAITQKIIANFETGFYDTVMMKGGTKWTYWIAQYLVDVLLLLIFVPMLELTAYLFGLVLPGISYLYILYAFAQPFFLYMICYLVGNVLKKFYWLVYVLSMLTVILGATLASVANGFAKAE